MDKLLESPRYGEHWARHWLDLVRYADSDGYKIDELRPNAWRYRDYVIRAFNEDKPYDRFVLEQLAGDELFPDSLDALVATGFLRHGIYEYNNRDAVGQWTNSLNEITDVTGDVFFGLGLQCARCHDHKFDPILQKDYFRLQAFFAPLRPRDDLPLATGAQQAHYAEALEPWKAKTVELRAEIQAIENPAKEKAAEDAIKKFPPETQAILRKPVAERTPWEKQIGELAFRQVLYEWDHLFGRLHAADKDKLVGLQKQLASFDKQKPAPLPAVPCVTDVGPEAPPVTIPKKANLGPIEPGFPSVLEEKPAVIGVARSEFHGTPRCTGPLAGAAGKSADRSRHRESRMAVALRAGPGRHHERFRDTGREALAPRVARLAGPALRARRLELQEAAPPHPALGGLSAVRGKPDGRSRPREKTRRTGFSGANIRRLDAPSRSATRSSA